MLVIPDFLGRRAFLEEKQISRNSGGVKGGLREADDSVQVAVGEEFLADALLVAVAGDAAVRQDDGAAATGLEELDHQNDEEVGGFPAAKGGGEVGLDAVGDAGSEGWIGEDDVDLLPGGDGVVFGLEAVDVVPVGHVDAVEDEIGEPEDVGDGFQLPAGDGFLENGFVVEGVDFVLANEVDGGAKETAGARGGVENFLPQRGRSHLRHELGDGAGGVVFALVPGVAQFDEDGLVDGAKDVAVLGVVKVEPIELVDDLAHLEAGLHVVVRTIEDFADEGGALRGFGGLELLEISEEPVGGMINKEDEILPGDALGIDGPVSPLEFLGDDGGVTVADEFEFLVLLVKDFQEKHPAKLLKSLGVAGDAAILSHDVADVFDDGRDIGHGVLCGLVKLLGQFMDSLVVGGLASKGANDLKRGAKLFDWIKGNDGHVFEIE